MKDNKQTSVEWLENELSKLYYDTQFKTLEEFHSKKAILWEQAKAMEKEQAKRMYTVEEVYDLLVEWDMYQKGEPRVDEDEIPNGFMSFNEWFLKISK